MGETLALLRDGADAYRYSIGFPEVRRSVGRVRRVVFASRSRHVPVRFTFASASRRIAFASCRVRVAFAFASRLRAWRRRRASCAWRRRNGPRVFSTTRERERESRRRSNRRRFPRSIPDAWSHTEGCRECPPVNRSPLGSSPPLRRSSFGASRVRRAARAAAAQVRQGLQGRPLGRARA